MYKIEFKKSAVKALRSIPRQDQIRIIEAIQPLAANPRPKDSVKLSESPYYRIRCGHYRVIYDIQDKVLIIVILKIGHRKDIYKR